MVKYNLYLQTTKDNKIWCYFRSCFFLNAFKNKPLQKMSVRKFADVSFRNKQKQTTYLEMQNVKAGQRIENVNHKNLTKLNILKKIRLIISEL